MFAPMNDEYMRGYLAAVHDLEALVRGLYENAEGGTIGGEGTTPVSSVSDLANTGEESKKNPAGGEGISLSGASVAPAGAMRVTIPDGSEGGGKDSSRDESSPIAEVWAAYMSLVVRPHKLRTKAMESAHRSLITAGLKVRTVEECVRAVEGLGASPHHKGINDRGRKYLDLRFALKGTHGESNGERIDKAGQWVIDPISAILATLPSEGRAILLREKKQIEDALEAPADEVLARRSINAAQHMRETWGLVALAGRGWIVDKR